MIEYRYLEALAAVIEEKGFEKAGETLHITQSAVTQRIRQLEEIAGQVLLVRSQPPEATKAGQLLLEHFRKIRILEQEFSAYSELNISRETPLIPIAVNADSLSTWFSPVASRFFSLSKAYLDIKSADQDVTHELMIRGDVMGCISSQKTAFRGCRKIFLGNMAYRIVSTREFRKRYFPEGIDETGFNAAPKLNFNRDDLLMANWAKQFFPGANAFHNSHFFPSSEQFPILIGRGAVCGMIPDEQFKEFRKALDLVDLSMGTPVLTPLYWHRWSIPSNELDNLTQLIKEESKKILVP